MQILTLWLILRTFGPFKGKEGLLEELLPIFLQLERLAKFLESRLDLLNITLVTLGQGGAEPGGGGDRGDGGDGGDGGENENNFGGGDGHRHSDGDGDGVLIGDNYRDENNNEF